MTKARTLSAASFLLAAAACFAAVLSAGCPGEGAGPRVVVYVALDRLYAQSILERFSEETGFARGGRPVTVSGGWGGSGGRRGRLSGR